MCLYFDLKKSSGAHKLRSFYYTSLNSYFNANSQLSSNFIKEQFLKTNFFTFSWIMISSFFVYALNFSITISGILLKTYILNKISRYLLLKCVSRYFELEKLTKQVYDFVLYRQNKWGADFLLCFWKGMKKFNLISF